MTIGSDDSMEDYEERFQLSYKRAKCTLDPESLKLVLLRGIQEDLFTHHKIKLLGSGNSMVKAPRGKIVMTQVKGWST